MPPSPRRPTSCSATAGIAPEETFGLGVDDGYAGAADSWAAGQPPLLEADDDEGAALAVYNLALDFQERSQENEARLLNQFEDASAKVMDRLGDLIIVDDDDERLVLGANGKFRAEVLPEDSDGEWRELTKTDELVEFYDPTDIFGDLADALAEAFPSIAPEGEEGAAEAEGLEGEGDVDGEERRRPMGPRQPTTPRPRPTATPTATGAPDPAFRTPA